MKPSQRILVTGAGRGIGKALSEKLLNAGHRVALCARTEADLMNIADSFPSNSLVVVADVLSEGVADETISRVVAEWGGLDVIILNAGDGVSVPLDKTTDATWNQMIDLNLTAPFKFMRAAVPVMKTQTTGNIIVIASKAGLVGEPNVAAYTAAKHGVVGLVRSAAAELGRYGITVNAVCPDFVDTPMTARSLQSAAQRTGKSVEEVRGALEAKLVGERLLTADEVADAAILFIGDKESNGITRLLEGAHQDENN